VEFFKKYAFSRRIDAEDACWSVKVAVIIREEIPKDFNDITDRCRQEVMKRDYGIEEINCLN
jgi:hypothetical protein